MGEFRHRAREYQIRVTGRCSRPARRRGHVDPLRAMMVGCTSAGVRAARRPRELPVHLGCLQVSCPDLLWAFLLAGGVRTSRLARVPDLHIWYGGTPHTTPGTTRTRAVTGAPPAATADSAGRRPGLQLSGPGGFLVSEASACVCIASAASIAYSAPAVRLRMDQLTSGWSRSGRGCSGSWPARPRQCHAASRHRRANWSSEAPRRRCS